MSISLSSSASSLKCYWLRKTRGMFGCCHAFPFDHHAEGYFLIYYYAPMSVSIHFSYLALNLFLWGQEQIHVV